MDVRCIVMLPLCFFSSLMKQYKNHGPVWFIMYISKLTAMMHYGQVLFHRALGEAPRSSLQDYRGGLRDGSKNPGSQMSSVFSEHIMVL